MVLGEVGGKRGQRDTQTVAHPLPPSGSQHLTHKDNHRMASFLSINSDVQEREGVSR